MKSTFFRAVFISGLALGLVAGGTHALAQTNLWVSAYYAGWSQGWTNNGILPAEAIDYSALTHVVHFALVPRADGTVDPDANSITTTNSAALVARAHAAGKKVLITVGGWATDAAFRSA